VKAKAFLKQLYTENNHELLELQEKTREANMFLETRYPIKLPNMPTITYSLCLFMKATTSERERERERKKKP
jgi:hypothetical protein